MKNQVNDQERLQVYLDCGRSAQKAAKRLGINRRNMDKWVLKARANGWLVDNEIQAAADAIGADDTANIGHFWRIVKDDSGSGYSVFVKNPQCADEEMSLADMIREAIEDGFKDRQPKFERRKAVKGEHLLVIDLADIHFRKLAIQQESGSMYNRDVARHRTIEGTKSLLRLAEPYSIGRILFVLGNDVLHTDGGKPTTTSGTPQDTDGSPFQAFSTALAALSEAIEMAAGVADVDLVHCMSNHDWFSGWALSQAIAARFEKHPNVHFTDYSMSEAHRKYFRFGNNLIGLSHGDGAKEEKLYGLMVQEVREHVGECKNLYWLLHHIHHRQKRIRGPEKPFLKEHDHNGLTAIINGHSRNEGEGLQIQYVRSPSAPDGWHDRNGFKGRQAVECFLFHENDGQIANFSEWF